MSYNDNQGNGQPGAFQINFEKQSRPSLANFLSPNGNQPSQLLTRKPSAYSQAVSDQAQINVNSKQLDRSLIEVNQEIDDKKQQDQSLNIDEEEYKQIEELIKQLELRLYKFFHKMEKQKKIPSQEEWDWVNEVSLNLSRQYQIMGEKLQQKKRYKEAIKNMLRSLQYTVPKELGEEGQQQLKKENKFDWYLQRISIANQLYTLFKRRGKASQIISTLRQVSNEFESSTLKNQIINHPQSNIENLLYYLAEYHLIRISTGQQQQLPSSSQQITKLPHNAGQQSLTNIPAGNQATIMLQQKNEMEETIRYAKQVINILLTKYKGKSGLSEILGQDFMDKKQIMMIHSLYLIGNILQLGELFTESLGFYKRALNMAQALFKKGGNEPSLGQAQLIEKYKFKIDQIIKIIQNDLDENLPPEQLAKYFREDLEHQQQESKRSIVKPDDKQMSKASLDFEEIAPLSVNSEVKEIFEEFGKDDSINDLMLPGLTVESQVNFQDDSRKDLQQPQSPKIKDIRQSNKKMEQRGIQSLIPSSNQLQSKKSGIVRDQVQGEMMPVKRRVSKPFLVQNPSYQQQETPNEVNNKLLKLTEKRLRGKETIEDLVKKVEQNMNEFQKYNQSFNFPSLNRTNSLIRQDQASNQQPLVSTNNYFKTSIPKSINWTHQINQKVQEKWDLNNEIKQSYQIQSQLQYQKQQQSQQQLLSQQQQQQQQQQGMKNKLHRPESHKGFILRNATSNTLISTGRPSSSGRFQAGGNLNKNNQRQFDEDEIYDDIQLQDKGIDNNNQNANFVATIKINQDREQNQIPLTNLSRFEDNLNLLNQGAFTSAPTIDKFTFLMSSRKDIFSNKLNPNRVLTVKQSKNSSFLAEEKKNLQLKISRKGKFVSVTSSQQQIDRVEGQKGYGADLKQKKKDNQNDNQQNMLSDKRKDQKMSDEKEMANSDEMQQNNPIQTPQKKSSFEVFENEEANAFIQNFDFDKVVNQKYERMAAEVDERNQKEKENSLQKLEYIGQDSKNIGQNQPSLQNKDDISSDEGDREQLLQEEKQQEQNQMNNVDHSPEEKLILTEAEKQLKEKQEYIYYKQMENRRVEEVRNMFDRVKQCRDRFVSFYQRYKNAQACIWKLEKFRIRFKVIQGPNQIGSIQNIKAKESLYAFTLYIDLESDFHTGKLIFSFSKSELDFLESILFQKNIISRWGIADMIITEYFQLPQNVKILQAWKSFYKNMKGDQNQLILSFSKGVGRYQGSFEVQENVELINVGIKLQFLVNQVIFLTRSPTGLKFKFGLKERRVSPSLVQIQSDQSEKESGEEDSLNSKKNEKQVVKIVDQEINETSRLTQAHNYSLIKEFLKIRRRIVRKSFITLEKISPQVYCRFGIQKKVKNSWKGEIQEEQNIYDTNEDYELQYQYVKQYVQMYKELLFESLHQFERSMYIYDQEQQSSKAISQASNQIHLQKQLELLSLRQRQKNSQGNFQLALTQQNKIIPPIQKTNQGFSSSQNLPFSPQSGSFFNSTNNSQMPHQQKLVPQISQNSNSQISRKGSFNHQEQIKNDNEIPNNDESLNELNNSQESSQSKQSTIKSSNQEIIRESKISRQGSFRKERDPSVQPEKQGNVDEEQFNLISQQIPVNAQIGANPQIERFHKRNLNKKSTFSLSRKTSNLNEQDNLNEGKFETKMLQSDQVDQEDNFTNNINNGESNASSNDKKFNSQPENNDYQELEEHSSNKTKRNRYSQGDFKDAIQQSQWMKNGSSGERSSSNNGTPSINQKWRKQSQNDPKEAIKLFKMNMNISMSSDDSFDKMKDDVDEDEDEEGIEDSIGGERRRKKSRMLIQTESSAGNQTPFDNQLSNIQQLFKSSNNINLKLPQEDRMSVSEYVNSPKSSGDHKNDRENNKRSQTPSHELLQQENTGTRILENNNQNNSNELNEQFETLAQQKIPIIQDDDNEERVNLQGLTLEKPKEDMKIPHSVFQQGSVENSPLISQLSPPLNWEDHVRMRVEEFQELLVIQEKMRFSTPMEYMQYFEDNKNITQIVIPNIFINPFSSQYFTYILNQKNLLLKRDLVLCGVTRLQSLTTSQYLSKQKEQEKQVEQKEEKLEEEEEEEENNFIRQKKEYEFQCTLDGNRKFNLENQEEKSDSFNGDLFLLEGRIIFEKKSSVEWDGQKVKEEVFIELIGTGLLEDYSKKYTGRFSFFEFIDQFFPEDNDLDLFHHYDQIQKVLHQESEERLQGHLHEEDFGFALSVLQYEELNNFRDMNLQFQKGIQTYSFRLSKFLYRMGFSSNEKKELFERFREQLVVVNNQDLKILTKKVRRFRLIDDAIVYLDDFQFNKYLEINPFPTILSFHQKPQITSNFQPASPSLSQSVSQRTSICKKKGDDLVTDENNEVQRRIQEQASQQLVNKDSQEMKDNDFKEVQMRDLSKDVIQIQYIIFSEKLYHLDQIITRKVESNLVLFEVLTSKQVQEKNALAIHDDSEPISQIRSRDQFRSIATTVLSDPFRDKDSLLQQSLSFQKTPVSLILGSSSVEQQSHPHQKATKFGTQMMTRFNAQKLTRKLKEAIKSVFNNIKYVNKEEREKNYNDGRIIHPHAMTYYNSVLKLRGLNQDKNATNTSNDRRRVEVRESWRREEDLRIIELNSRRDGFRKKLKTEYKIDSQGELYVKISYYDPLQYRLEKANVKEKKNLEKLQNLLQVSNKILQGNALRDILLKINLKWNKKIIGRKLEFRSFIETNEDFFKYKLNRKKNPNDEALFKLMTTKNYLEENIKQYTNFLYKVKLALISNDQNAETAEQNYFFNTYFYSTRVQQFQKIQNLGKALIQTTVYQSKQLYTLDNFVFIRIDIAPASKRTKLIKMILDFNDITTIFTDTKYNLENCLDTESICKMIKEFAEKVNYSHTQNYNALKIPFWKQFNQVSESSDYDLMNQFDFNSMNTKQEISFLSKKSMMTPVLRTLKIIYQGIKKIDNQFLLITVKRYIYLNIDWFQLIIYIPKTSRRFICYMMEADLLKFEPEFMEKVVPLVIVKYESNIQELKQYKNYLQFCEAFEQMHKKLNMYQPTESFRKTDTKKTIRSFDNWSKKISQEEMKIKNSFAFIRMEGLGEQKSYPSSLNSIVSLHDFNDKKKKCNDGTLNSSLEHKSPISSKYVTQGINFVKYFQKNLTDQTSFLEKKVWEHLISTIIIEENEQNKLLLKINTFSGILRETLSSMVLNMNERDNILYEFYIENMDKTTQQRPFIDSKSIQLEESFNQNLYVRITFFGQDTVHNQKVCGRHMLFSYHKMSRSKLKNKKVEQLSPLKPPIKSTGFDNKQKIDFKNMKISEIQPQPQNFKVIKPSTKQEGVQEYFRVGQNIERKQKSVTLQFQTTNKDENPKTVAAATSVISGGSQSKSQVFSTNKSLAVQQTEIQDNPFLYSFILADMQEMAIFYANKIKANYNLFVKEREQKQLKGKLSSYLSLYKSKSLFKDSECEPILRFNKSFKRHRKIEEESPKYFIISRKILTVTPRQMIAFFYQPSKSLFIISCWNSNNSKQVTVKKKLKEIEKHIPHTVQLLNSKLYKELGDRLFLCQKNQILLDSYKYLKDQ